jgi:hypothetical protein
MSTDFGKASGRHLRDGELLLSERRWAGADHLFGLSAECSLKAVMEALGMKMTPDGSAPVDRGHKVHMPELWSAYQSFAQGRLQARYLTLHDHGNPFSDWQVDQRYWSDADVAEGPAMAHAGAATRCIGSLHVLILDGVRE